MDFSSDTSAPAHPAVLEALTKANSGQAASYGDDVCTGRVKAQLQRLFETDALEIWICASGTAANALALSLVCSPTGAILCHKEAHIERDERGAPEFFTGGGKLSLLPGAAGKIDKSALIGALDSFDTSFVHETPPEALSLTNLTECGTAYSAQVIKDYCDLAHAKGLSVHLDGARLGNALAGSSASPAEMTWKAGVDILTLGLTKTGAIGCEIIVMFADMARKFPELQARAKRSGHMPPKMRYLAAQAHALLTDGLWLELAGKANRAAKTLADGFVSLGIELVYPVDGNEVFAALSVSQADALRSKGAKFYSWPGGSHRFVCSWMTAQAEIDDLMTRVVSKT